MKKVMIYFLIITICLLAGCSNNHAKLINKTENPKTGIVVSSQNSVEQKLKSKDSIPFNCFYSGFVLENDMFELPRGTVLLNSESEWKAFKNKYFSKNIDMEYCRIPDDFTKQSIVYYSVFSSEPSTFAEAFQIKEIEVSDNKLSAISEELGSTKITVSNYDSLMYRFVVLAAVNKSDISNVNMPDKQGVDEKWESIDRIRYIQGTIVSLKKISHGKSILHLKIEKDYHDRTDPVDTPDFPFKPRSIVEFYINSQPKMDLNKIKRVILYECDVTTNQNDCFLAANIKYYESHGKFYDMNGKQISLPPTDYPQLF